MYDPLYTTWNGPYVMGAHWSHLIETLPLSMSTETGISLDVGSGCNIHIWVCISENGGITVAQW